MKVMIKVFIICLCLVSASVMAAKLGLPPKLPELGTTNQSDLGVREDNIGLAVGNQVSEFVINDHTGKPTSLTSLQERGKLLVIFYRGGWCPFCNVQIRQLTEAWPEFEKRGVIPVLISADKPDAAALASSKYEIPFPVLSDSDLIAHNIFQVTSKLDQKTVEKYKKYGMSLKDWNGKDHNSFAVASAFIVNSAGKVEWAHSSKDYRKRPSVEQLLTVIDGQ